ncbi:MAG: maltose alpha-D-glucosyltransferase [Candidatus Eremiobacteraeota bacterium]|nr:maltose alpha-D-glucosyltransferase [Candidatus Eremiobacteraeota bacterium]
MALDNDRYWYKDAVIYQLHVKAFFDADDDGIGDFRGLTNKLDYIKSLGATCVWLLPFFPSPMRDDGYDIADYRAINPAFGTTQEFRQFVRAAHERGLRVLIELVINHTSDQHAWFQRARRAKAGSAWRDFYVWSDSDKKYADCRIIFSDTETSNWTWDPIAGQYYWHRFFSHQPDLNFDNPRVIEAILGVMRFWLETGVDGLRLDAVPYLCEREGTGCENLPETHGVLKILRAVLDAEYPDRVFLAEANQWPEDVRPYFGDGDECHMAFHFPLMPRMFIAIAEEDRYPIVDIMRQTPDIPPSCQWAIFLRNHDEMTLEMVTERERDHMYRIYASEPRSRINVGIRRRLAPLMENDTRRIELLTGLLLSMPGTPIVYYGDELGMGDNIYLSDRDGVRTPMQWSIDRNGGFSRADPARLFLPPIADPVYGYATVNVESQSRSPSSKLNWLRKLIGVRQGYKVFGRGTLRFLSPSNRKIIAYVREYENEHVLCVANLARSAQQVALDLADYKGRVPIEMVGWSAFAGVGDERYMLSLPGHGFYWFLLSDSAQAPSWDTGDLPGQIPELLTLVLPHDGGTALGPKALATLERDVLPNYLPNQRWFADKDGALPAAAVVDTVRIGTGAVTSLTVVDALQRYFVPLAIVDESDERNLPAARATLARTRTGPHSGFLCDGFAVDALPLAVLEMVREGRRYTSTRGGTFSGSPTPALRELELAKNPRVERIDVEQSNTSVVFDDRVILKGYRRIVAGAQPELEVARFLDAVGYRNTPPLYGFVEHTGSNGEIAALCILQAFVENRGDGWTATLAYLDRFFDRRRSLDADAGHGATTAVTAGFDGRDAAPRERLEFDEHEVFVTRIRHLGVRTAELHRAFATPLGDAAFEPEPTADADLAAWSAQARMSAEAALASLARELERVPADLREFASDLLERRDELLGLTQLDLSGMNGLVKTRYHGDFHLGQVLVVADDFMIVDFEGEPSRPLAQRRSKSSPLRDVAGMLRSLNYAAVAAMRGVEADRAGNTAALEPYALDWERRSVAAFLDGYRERIAGCASYPAERTVAERLLDHFVLEKAFYEMSYELANRPAWVRIPLEGIRGILERLSAAAARGPASPANFVASAADEYAAR